MKKSSKKSSSTTKTKKTKLGQGLIKGLTEAVSAKEEVRKIAPPAPEAMIGVFMSADDLRTLANLMTICSRTFENLALQSAEKADEASFTIYQARHRLSAMFAEKLVDSCKMPEPVSRDFH